MKSAHNRLETKLTQLKEQGEKALATFLMGGDPDLNNSISLCEAVIEGGADILEIGVPFSDPLADGSVNQKAARRALNNGVNINNIFDMVGSLRQRYENIPIVLLLYYNTIFQYGGAAFQEQARDKGVDGLIIPDLPLEEKELLADEVDIEDPIFINLLAPTTMEDRMKNLLMQARGFVYCVSQAGVTGMKDNISPEIFPMFQKARKYTNIPLLAGFGISNPEQARDICKGADGVIIGSVLVKEVERYGQQGGQAAQVVRNKVQEFKDAIS